MNIPTISRAALPVALAGLACLATAPAAARGVAQPSDGAPSVAIEWRDLDLDTAQGRRTLDRRIESGAAKACRASDINTGSRLAAREVRDCMETARREANAQVARMRSATRSRG